VSTTSTDIAWTDRTWSPVRGCSRVSDGCQNCYAIRQAHRFSGKGQPYEGLTTIRRGKVDWTGVARFIPEQLGAPLKWRKPVRIFVNSMSDLFHPSLSNEEIAAVFGVMAACPQHTFQVLTKQPKRAAEWFKWVDGSGAAIESLPLDRCASLADDALLNLLPRPARAMAFAPGRGSKRWPLPNVHLGVSAENQKTADERIPILLTIPAAVRFVSAEPLLERVDLSFGLSGTSTHHMCVDVAGALRNRSFSGMLDADTGRELTRAEAKAALEKLLAQGVRVLPMAKECDGFSDQKGCPGHRNARLDWVIAGGESGPGARPCDVAWIESIVQQCREASVPCFVKQLGAKPYDSRDQRHFVDIADKKGGDPSEWPESLRVRQFPEDAK